MIIVVLHNLIRISINQFRDINTHLVDICLNLEVKHTECNQMVMSVKMWLNANSS